MWLVRQRFWQSSQVFTLCSLLLAAGFILQFRVLYHSHLKNQRLQDYNQMINDLSATESRIDKMANSTSSLINRLESTVNKNVKKSLRTS